MHPPLLLNERLTPSWKPSSWNRFQTEDAAGRTNLVASGLLQLRSGFYALCQAGVNDFS